MGNGIAEVLSLVLEVLKDMFGIEWVRIGMFLILGVIIGCYLGSKNKSGGDPAGNDELEFLILKRLFGSPVYAVKFGLHDVREWLSPRNNQLKNGTQAVVFKVNSTALRMFINESKRLGLNFDDHERIGKFLVIVIYDDSRQAYTDSLLVKYQDLDKQLDDLLASSGDKFIYTDH
ncbi:MAG: hypothetical protein IJP54_01250 [Synergistaceae bacterium]|nr:hypothetical protein [Synergistaceae bacterium]